MRIRPLIKYFGGKYYLSDKLIEYFPRNYVNMDYHQPCIGGGNPFLSKMKSNRSETISDLNIDIVSLWRTVRDNCNEFKEKLYGIPYTINSFSFYKDNYFINPIDIAVKTFVIYRMSRSGRGDTFSWSDRERGGQPESINAYESAIENLDLISKRLQGVTIKLENCWDAVDYASPDTFIYLDPPYRTGERTTSNVYELEMTDDDHVRLAYSCRRSKAKIMISHYSDLFYNDVYKNWRSIGFDIVNNSSESKEKSIKQEIIWMNY